MVEEKQKEVEKYFIEVSASAKKRFFISLAGGVGWGIGLTIGTAFVLALLGFFVSKIDFVPFLGQFSAEIIKAAQFNLNAR